MIQHMDAGLGSSARGDEAGAQRRFEELLPEVLKIPGQYTNIVGATLDELQQEARIALILAARAFDSGKGTSFKGYAMTAVHNRLKSLHRKVRRYGELVTSMERPDDEDGLELESTFRDAGPLPIDGVARREARRVLDEVINELDARARRVVRAYFNYELGPDVAEELGITKQAISAISQRAMKLLRKKLEDRGIESSPMLLSRGPNASGFDNPIVIDPVTGEVFDLSGFGESLASLATRAQDVDADPPAQLTDEQESQLVVRQSYLLVFIRQLD